jgi:hypothetical protein
LLKDTLKLIADSERGSPRPWPATRVHEGTQPTEQTHKASRNQGLQREELSGLGAITEKWTDLRRIFFERATSYFSELAGRVPEALLAHALSAPTAEGTVAEAMSGVLLEDEDLSEDDRTIAAAIARGVVEKKNLLEEAGGAYTSEQLAKVLGISPQAVHGGRQTNLYFGVPVARGIRYPKFQVTELGILPGLRQCLNAFTLPDPWMKLAVLLAPSERLNGLSPLQVLRDGDIAAAVKVAQAYGSHGA